MIQTIERENVIVQKVELTRSAKSDWMSARLMPNWMKSLASSGLKTMYAKNDPKKMSETTKSAQTILRKSIGRMGSFFFLGGGGVAGTQAPLPEEPSAPSRTMPGIEASGVG